MKNPKYIAIAAITLDGKIAKHSKHFSSWTSKEDKQFLHAILDACDVIIVGNSTYQMAKKPLSKRRCLIITRSPHQYTNLPNCFFINPAKQSLKKIIGQNKYQKIAILGGAQIYSYCLKNKMLDELYLTIEPISFGCGISLFENQQTTKWKLRAIKKLNNVGTILLHYTLK